MTDGNAELCTLASINTVKWGLRYWFPAVAKHICVTAWLRTRWRMANASNLHFETLAIHAGQAPDPVSGAVMQPIVLSSTFAQDGPGNHKGFEYSRTSNPTRVALEQCLAALEDGEHGMCFASGCAAMTTFLHTLKPGDHIIAGDDLYGGSFRILDKVMRPMGIDYTQVDLCDPEALDRAVRPSTKVVWLETPTNPMLKLVDIKQVSARAKAKGLCVVVDNTFATPYLQQPLKMGADVVIHSMTKYLNGHSDVVGGVLIVRDAQLAERIRFYQNAMGSIPSPFDCYMVLRGLKTLHVRMRQHLEGAQAIAEYLEKHKSVERVIFPGLASHPHNALCKEQMGGPGGMISFVIRGGAQAADQFLRALRIFVCAESLGGVESLIELPAVMTHGSIPTEQRHALGIVDGLIRISVGIESVTDLIADLDQAFARAQ